MSLYKPANQSLTDRPPKILLATAVRIRNSSSFSLFGSGRARRERRARGKPASSLSESSPLSEGTYVSSFQSSSACSSLLAYLCVAATVPSRSSSASSRTLLARTSLPSCMELQSSDVVKPWTFGVVGSRSRMFSRLARIRRTRPLIAGPVSLAVGYMLSIADLMGLKPLLSVV